MGKVGGRQTVNKVMYNMMAGVVDAKKTTDEA